MIDVGYTNRCIQITIENLPKNCDKCKNIQNNVDQKLNNNKSIYNLQKNKSKKLLKIYNFNTDLFF